MVYFRLGKIVLNKYTKILIFDVTKNFFTISENVFYALSSLFIVKMYTWSFIKCCAWGLAKRLALIFLEVSHENFVIDISSSFPFCLTS